MCFHVSLCLCVSVSSLWLSLSSSVPLCSLALDLPIYPPCLHLHLHAFPLLHSHALESAFYVSCSTLLSHSVCMIECLDVGNVLFTASNSTENATAWYAVLNEHVNDTSYVSTAPSQTWTASFWTISSPNGTNTSTSLYASRLCMDGWCDTRYTADLVWGGSQCPHCSLICGCYVLLYPFSVPSFLLNTLLTVLFSRQAMHTLGQFSPIRRPRFTAGCFLCSRPGSPPRAVSTLHICS